MTDIGISGLRSADRSALNEHFRSGWPPDPPLDGRTSGELIRLEIAPVVTQLFSALLARVCLGRARPSMRHHPGATTFSLEVRCDWLGCSIRAIAGFEAMALKPTAPFAFRTYLAPGLEDADRTVLKIDYDLPENPKLTVRRVLDELVQIGDGAYLGKAHVKWWWGRWQRVAFFALFEPTRSP